MQRVTDASVDVEGTTVGAIGRGLLVLVGIEPRDTIDDIVWLSAKLWNMRLWPNDANKPWMTSAAQCKYELLVVSQFTLHARLKGNKPDFHAALAPDRAEVLFNLLISQLNTLVPEGGKPVSTGTFGAKMDVKLTNDGPVTVTLDSQEVKFPRKAKAAPRKATAPGVPQESREVDVPWLAPTGQPSQDEIIPMEANESGIFEPPAGSLPAETEMTSVMHAILPDTQPGDVEDVPLPSGMTVKIRVPPGKQPGDVLQVTLPKVLMNPNFQQVQQQARMNQLVAVDFKVPPGASAGDEVPVPLPNGATVKVKIPEGKVAGDVFQVRVPRGALQNQRRVQFTVPEGKKGGDEIDLTVSPGRTIKVTIPEGRVAGDKLWIELQPPQIRVPPGTPMVDHTVQVPEGAAPGDTVKFALPSGIAVSSKIPEGKSPGDDMVLKVPQPFLDPEYRQKQARAAQRAATAEQVQQRGPSKIVSKKPKGKKKKKKKK